jgi:dTDP-4-dehydrorhamnose 3,5-epimerase
MKILATEIPGVVVLEPKVFEDQRGFFMETYRKSLFRELGVAADFVQDNHSRSVKNTLRGLHYQIQCPQGKLVRVVRGEVFDVAVDLRRDSPTFGRWVGVALSEQNRLQLYIPPGLAHGFCVTSDVAEFVYKCTDYWRPEFERTLLWNDAHVGVKWPACEPLLSDKDRRGLPWSEAPVYETSP